MNCQYYCYYWWIFYCLGMSTATALRDWKCSIIPRYRHYKLLFWRAQFVHPRHPSMAKWFRFRTYTPYNLGTDCQTDWNKLWGKSRCGNHHHQDSDRFVWRAASDGSIQLAAYAYDQSRKPFQHEGTLLQTFVTTIQPDQIVGSKMEWYLNRTEYSLHDDSGSLLEVITIEHENECSNFERGYELGLYFGGNCRAPDRVSVCFQDASDL